MTEFKSIYHTGFAVSVFGDAAGNLIVEAGQGDDSTGVVLPASDAVAFAEAVLSAAGIDAVILTDLPDVKEIERHPGWFEAGEMSVRGDEALREAADEIEGAPWMICDEVTYRHRCILNDAAEHIRSLASTGEGNRPPGCTCYGMSVAAALDCGISAHRVAAASTEDGDRYVSIREVERALRAADYPEDSMATEEDCLRYTGRADAVEIVREMLELAASTGEGES